MGQRFTARFRHPPTEFVQSVIDGLCELSLKDPLTGLANRRHFMSVLEREIDGVARSGEPALLLMLDIDHFKNINDTHGHLGRRPGVAGGGQVPGALHPTDGLGGALWRRGVRRGAAQLPGVGRRGSGRTYPAMTVESLTIPVGPVSNVRATISIGGAYAPAWVRSTAPLWIERADSLLYRAKAARAQSGLHRSPTSHCSQCGGEESFVWSFSPG